MTLLSGFQKAFKQVLACYAFLHPDIHIQLCDLTNGVVWMDVRSVSFHIIY
jgi:hypothetical protein